MFLNPVVIEIGVPLIMDPHPVPTHHDNYGKQEVKWSENIFLKNWL